MTAQQFEPSEVFLKLLRDLVRAADAMPEARRRELEVIFAPRAARTEQIKN